MPFDYTVPPPIQAIDQGDADLCWAAATTVLFNWRAVAPISMTDAVGRLGVEFVALFAANKGVPTSEVGLWASRGGFTADGLQCIDAAGWDAKMRASGPLIAMIDGTGGGVIDHAVVVYGIQGDGTPGGTTLRVANGQGAMLQTWTLSDFVTLFEAEAGENLNFGLLYFAS